jgi:hypothetical protein
MTLGQLIEPVLDVVHHDEELDVVNDDEEVG